jgi:hypothetical protein
MFCYARRATSMTGIALVAIVLFGAPTVHFLNVAALMTAIAVVAGGTAAAGALVFVALRSVRKRRALAGGCVACQLKCQHAMTSFGAPRASRLWLVSTVNRSAPAPGREPVIPDRRTVVDLPLPRWPDAPLRTATAPLHASTPPALERVPAAAR